VFDILTGMFSLFGARVDIYNKIAELPNDVYNAMANKNPYLRDYYSQRVQQKAMGIPLEFIPFIGKAVNAYREIFNKTHKSGGKEYDYSIDRKIKRALREGNLPKLATETKGVPVFSV